ncbi:MAG: helix-turn-helix domain-containing protein [Halanaerobiales bacterium]|nr:helix-turn-helix domain-containing protein [Halanaerobiales bacterium]
MAIGNKLKKARKSMGLTLDDIKNKSKIKKSYLEALENDNFEKLPGEVYTKVYIRGYAKIVGLDPKKVLSEYERQKNNDKNIKGKNKNENKKKSNGKQNSFLNKDTILKGLLGIILILIIVLLSYNIFFRTDQSQNNTANNNQNTEVVQEDKTNENNSNEDSNGESNTAEISDEELETDLNNIENNNDQNVTSSNEKNTTEQSDSNNNGDNNNQEQKPLMKDKSKEIKIIASDKSWLQVNVDGELKFQGFINEDETMTHSGNETIRLKIGNGIAVKVEFDGEKLGPFGQRGEVIIKEFDI